MRTPSRCLAAAVLVAIATSPAAAHAHTDTDLVAVPAGQEATIALEPQHGCGDSPTVEVAIQVPVADAVPGEVEGWTATATPDGRRTVLEWTGGSLPADQPGDFPASFVAPDAVGELLVFPAVQVCENGEELAWIDGDPEGEYPAPRLLVLPPDAAPAATIDDVPPDAPGRDQLVLPIDVDNPSGTTTTTDEPGTTERPRTTTTTERPGTTEEPPGNDQRPSAVDDQAAEEDGDAVVWLVVAVLVAAVIGVIAWALLRRRH